MVTPTKQDLDKKKKLLEEHKKHLTKEGKLTEKKLVSLLRSAIRKVWMSAPNKLYKLELSRIPDMDPNTRTKWLFRCEKCGELFKENEIELDHRLGNHKFTELADFPNFCDKILNAGVDDLQALCQKTCHSTKTLLESRGLDWTDDKVWQQGLIEKEVLKITKLKSKDQQQWLISKGVTPNKSPKIREQQIREILENEQR